MKKKKTDSPRKRKKSGSVRYYRDGELVGDAVLVTTDAGLTELDRTVLVLCPDYLLEEIDRLSEFNYTDRSVFMSLACEQLADYLESRSMEALAELGKPLPAGVTFPEDILMSAELYPYDEDEGDGILWGAENEDE